MPLRNIFPPPTLDIPTCHDDTTIIAPTYINPPDDPEGDRLAATPTSELRKLILAAAHAGGSALSAAIRIHKGAQHAPPLTPEMAALTAVVIPHFPLIIAAFAELVYAELGMRIAPGHKMKFFQLPQEDGSRHAIDAEHAVWGPLLPEGVTYTHDTYRVAGGDVGEAKAITHRIKEQTKEWEDLLLTVSTTEGRLIYPTFLAIKMAFNPVTKFGHHLACQPITITEDIATDTKHALTTAFTNLIGLAPGSIAGSDLTAARELRLYTPAGDGGVGLADPVTIRMTSSPADFINTLPLLLANPNVATYVSETHKWEDSPSPTLRDMRACLLTAAEVIRAEMAERDQAANVRYTAYHDVGATHVAQTILEAVTANSIDIDRLATAAHRHPQRGLARYFHPYMLRVQRAHHPWRPDTVIAHEGSKWRGADAMANAHTVTHHTKLTNDEATFWLCHKLNIKLPFLSPHAYCHRSCNRVPQPRTAMAPTHDLYGTFQHAYHQINCTLFWTTTVRHDAYLEAIAWALRKICGILAFTGQYLNKDYNSRKSTDILVTFPGNPDRWPTAMDYTCMCPFLPKYRKSAITDFGKMMTQRAAEKIRKHQAYCASQRRTFVAAPGTTLGSTGGKEYWDVIDAAFAYAMMRDQAAGGTGYAKQEEKQAFLARLHAILIRYTAQHIIELSGRT